MTTGPAARVPVRFVLASASPARAGLLTAAGMSFEVRASTVDEDALIADRPSVPPADIAIVLAVAKARAVAADLGWAAGSAAVSVAEDPGPDPDIIDVLMGCDSVLEVPDVPDLAGRALGKPSDSADAVGRWRAMRGHTGVLHTGHCLLTRSRDGSVAVRSALASTMVHFAADITDAEIVEYVASGEPLAVAGAFTLDGRAMPFIDGVEGDPSNVIGLSVPLLRRMLRAAGVPWSQLAVG